MIGNGELVTTWRVCTSFGYTIITVRWAQGAHHNNLENWLATMEPKILHLTLGVNCYYHKAHEAYNMLTMCSGTSPLQGTYSTIWYHGVHNQENEN